jgi:hypothetical protein
VQPAKKSFPNDPAAWQRGKRREGGREGGREGIREGSGRLGWSCPTPEFFLSPTSTHLFFVNRPTQACLRRGCLRPSSCAIASRHRGLPKPPCHLRKHSPIWAAHRP